MRCSVHRAGFVRSVFAAVLGVLLTATVPPALAAPAASAAVPERAYQDLRWRLLGPFRGGWAT